MDILQTRRYDLDWLRVIAFGLLIFYHIGMFYVSWDFHVKRRSCGAICRTAYEAPQSVAAFAFVFYLRGCDPLC